jgi:hypothetical protein
MLRCLHLFSSQKKTKTISYPQSSDSNPHRDNHLDGFIATIGITFVVVSLKEKHQYCILESFAIGVEEDYNIRVVLYCAISSNLRPDTISFQFYNARPVLHLDNKQFPFGDKNNINFAAALLASGYAKTLVHLHSWNPFKSAPYASKTLQ